MVLNAGPAYDNMCACVKTILDDGLAISDILFCLLNCFYIKNMITSFIQNGLYVALQYFHLSMVLVVLLLLKVMFHYNECMAIKSYRIKLYYEYVVGMLIYVCIIYLYALFIFIFIYE